MKKFIVSVSIIAIVIMLVTFLQDNTYSKFKKGININITDTTGKLVCDATLDNPGTYVSDDGWAYFKVIVKNYDSNDVITDVPVEYYLDIKNSNGSNALYRVTTADETSIFMSPLTTSNYLFAAGEKQTNEFIIEVKTGAEDAEDVDFDVDLTCRQVSKNAATSLVPILTENNGFVITSYYGTGEGSAFYVFDNDDSTLWSGSTKTNQYVGYHFNNPVKVVKVNLKPSNTSGYARVKNFRIEASNDNSTWTTLYTGLYDNSTESIKKEYDITNDNFYSYYRIYVIDNYAPNTNMYIRIDTLEFIGYSS